MAFTTSVVAEQVNASKKTPLAIGLTVFYTSIGVLCLAYLIFTLVAYPLEDAEAGTASWSGAWSVVALVDFYVATLCMCGIILMTQGLISGIVWSLFILLLGSPVVCLYMFNVFRWYGGFALVSNVIYQRPSGTSAPNLEGTLGMGYILLCIAIMVRLVWNYTQHPFFPMDTESDTWAWEWLLTAIANFYAVALCICGIIISSQQGFTSSVWCLCTLILGAPVCCIYMAFRLLKYGTIALACHPDAAKEMGEDVPPILRRTSSKAFAPSPSETNPYGVPSLRRSSSKQSTTSRDSKEVQQFGARTSGGGDTARVSRATSKESSQPRMSASSRQTSKEFGEKWSGRSEGEGRRTPRTPSTPSGVPRIASTPSKEWNGNARASPRVLVHAAASARSASKEAANESDAPATAAHEGRGVNPVAHDMEADEPSYADQVDVI